jgi:cold-inducible RNA-binding protein
MGTKIFVGNLPGSVTEDDLKTHFNQAGKVINVVLSKANIKGKVIGTGVIEMATDEEGQKAITMFHGRNFMGKPITVGDEPTIHFP